MAVENRRPRNNEQVNRCIPLLEIENPNDIERKWKGNEMQIKIGLVPSNELRH